MSAIASQQVVNEEHPMSLLPHIEKETGPNPDAAIIWLHGLGADGHDFEPLVPELRLPKSSAVRFIFPHAPAIPVTINGGVRMPAWYDILSMSIERAVDEAQLLKSAERVQAFIDREIERGIDSRRIVLAGFSQGGAVVYQAGLACPQPLAGLLGLSTYFATYRTLKVNPANQDTPIQIYHGRVDPVVPESLGQQSVKAMQAMGLKPQYKTYMMQHSVCPEEIKDISTWLQTVLKL